MRLVILDCETRSLKLETEDDLTELALLEIDSDDPGREGRIYHSLNQPGGPIAEEITELNGLRDEDVRGQHIDWQRVSAFLKDAVVVGHNIGFDRLHVERLLESVPRRWLCSRSMVDWKAHQLPCAKQRHLLFEHGRVPHSHRALDDVRDLAELLSLGPWDRLVNRPLKSPFTSPTYLEELLESLEMKFYLLALSDTSRDMNDALKVNGFRWAPQRKWWWRFYNERQAIIADPWLQHLSVGRKPKIQWFEEDPTDPMIERKYQLT